MKSSVLSFLNFQFDPGGFVIGFSINESDAIAGCHTVRSVRLPTGGYVTVIERPDCAGAGVLRRQPDQHPGLFEDGADCATHSLRMDDTNIF